MELGYRFPLYSSSVLVIIYLNFESTKKGYSLLIMKFIIIIKLKSQKVKELINQLHYEYFLRSMFDFYTNRFTDIRFSTVQVKTTIPRGGMEISTDLSNPCQGTLVIFKSPFSIPDPPYSLASLLNISVRGSVFGTPTLYFIFGVGVKLQAI